MYVCMYVCKEGTGLGRGRKNRSGRGGEGEKGETLIYLSHTHVHRPPPDRQTDRWTDRWTMSVVGCIFKTTPGAYIAHMDKYVGR